MGQAVAVIMLALVCWKLKTISACDSIEVRNTLYQKTSEGVYLKMGSSYTCNNRPGYEQSEDTVTGSKNFIFNIAYTAINAWMIGPIWCHLSGSILAIDSSTSPDMVKTTWLENNDTHLVLNHNLDVSCYEPPCFMIKVRGIKYQSSLEDEYEMLPYSSRCFSRPTYKHTSIMDVYLFFYQSNETMFHAWIIGQELCSNLGYIHAIDDALTPDKVEAVWQEYDSVNKLWRLSVDLKVECHRYTHCEAVEVRDTLFHSDLEGVYIELNNRACYRRLVYVQSGESGSLNYLFYFEKSDGFKGWMIGDTACSSTRSIFAEDSAKSPENVASHWKEVDENNVMRDSDMYVQCYSETSTINPTSPSGLSTAVIGGIVGAVAGVIILVIVAVAACCWMRNNSAARKQNQRGEIIQPSAHQLSNITAPPSYHTAVGLN